MRIYKKAILLSLIIAMCLISLTFADDGRPSGFLGMVYDLIKWIPTVLGDILNAALQIKPETIYLGEVKNGVLVKPSPFLFRFSLSNYFGGYSSIVYKLTSLIATMLVSIMASVTAIKLLLSNTAQARANAIESVKTLFIGVLCFWFLPDLLNFIFGIRDKLLVSIHYLFAKGADVGFIDQMKLVADAGGILEACIYFAASVFTLWLLFNYVTLGFGFTAVLFIFPIALVLSPQTQLKKTVEDLKNSILSYIATPLLDITLLGIIAKVVSSPIADLKGYPTIIPYLMHAAVIMAVIPTRSAIKQKLGWGNAVGDMVGAGMFMMAAGMMTRGMKSPKMSSKGKGQQEEPDYQGQANYHQQLAEQGTGGGQAPQTMGTDSGRQSSDLPPLSTSSSVSSAAMPNSSTNSSASSREAFIDEHMGKPYFNPKDINMSNAEKARAYQNLATRQAEKRKTDSAKAALNNLGRTSAGAVGGLVGGSAGLFMGPGAVAAGAYMGASAGGWAYDKAAKAAPFVHSSIENLSARLHASGIGQAAEAVFDEPIEAPQTVETGMVQSNVQSEVIYDLKMDEEGVNEHVAHPVADPIRPIIKDTAKSAAVSMNEVLHTQYRNGLVKIAEANIAKDPANSTKYLSEMNDKIRLSHEVEPKTREVYEENAGQMSQNVVNSLVQADIKAGQTATFEQFHNSARELAKQEMPQVTQSVVEYAKELGIDFEIILDVQE